MKENYLTTKQFAELCKVEKRTLFYYDEIDLLKPMDISENGYRRYSREQFDTLSMIKALQSIGMSLGEIKAFMNQQDLSHCKEVLNNQIHLLKEKQEELKTAEHILSNTMEQLNCYFEVGCNKFFIEEAEEVYLITKDRPEENKEFINYITNGYHLGVIMQEDAPTVPQCVFKKAPNRKSANAIKPAGAYASIYESVPNGKLTDTIENFMKLLSTKRLISDGPLYLYDTASDFISFPNQEVIFKLSMKCKPSN